MVKEAKRVNCLRNKKINEHCYASIWTSHKRSTDRPTAFVNEFLSFQYELSFFFHKYFRECYTCMFIFCVAGSFGCV